MVVSQWGLVSKNSGCKTSPGHPMVVSQWSNPEQQPTQLAALLLKPDPKFPTPPLPHSPTPRRTTVLSPATYPSRTWGRSQQSPPSFPERKPASSTATDSEGKDDQTAVNSLLWPAARGKASARPWWSASGDLSARTADARPARAPHGGQPVEQPRATANTTCGSIIERPTQSSQHPGTQLCSVRPHTQVEPGAAVSRALLVSRKKACE